MVETRSGNGIGKMLLSLALFFVVSFGGILGGIVAMLFGWDIDLWYTSFEAVLTIFALVCLGGAAWLRFDRKAIIESWRFMWWIILASAVLMVWDILDYVQAGELVQKGWFLRCLHSLLLCTAIGVSEEGMFRGLLFGGMLSKGGGSKRGIYLAVLLSSLAFGCAHITLDDIDLNNWLTVVQALLKICQTGIYAVMLCAVILKTKNFIGAMMIHALDDYLVFVVSMGLFGETFDVEYVTPDADEAVSIIIFYLIIIALYMPTFIKAIRELRSIDLPQYGPFETQAKQAPAQLEGQAYPYYAPAPQPMPGLPAEQLPQQYPAYGQYPQYEQYPQYAAYGQQEPMQQPSCYPVPMPAPQELPNSTVDPQTPNWANANFPTSGQSPYPSADPYAQPYQQPYPAEYPQPSSPLPPRPAGL